MEPASLLPFSKLHTDFSCPNPEPHREGDSAKYISHLAEGPRYKSTLFVLCVVSAEKLVQCLAWAYIPDCGVLEKRRGQEEL